MPRENRKFHKPREKSEYDQKVLDIRRVARVVAGGRRFSFRATVVIGNRKGKVGVGVAKGGDVTVAIEKATAKARKRIVIVPISKFGSIPHDVEAKFSAARVLLRPAPPGSGIIAGGPVRVVASLAGIQNLSSKILSRTPNKLNNALAAMEGLKKLRA
ncbi:30S ribosomal protein S5 [Patescibacteria group bacterium]|nr:30S ribosomal protein S5 [Patescibacteria group bacterium]